jgi:hypothetical protein
MRAYLPGEFYPRYNDQIEELIAKEAQAAARSKLAAISSSAAHGQDDLPANRP